MSNNPLNINTPIGIPSGWEEVVAFLDISASNFKACALACFEMKGAPPWSLEIWEAPHDWRVEE